jgi:hypothetical protein
MPVIAVRRLFAIFALAVVAALVAAAPSGAQTQAKCSAYTVLKPGNEVRDGDVDPVDSRAFGASAIHINGDRLTFSTAIANPFREVFFAGHIHIGAADVNGPVVVTLFPGPDTDRRLFTQLRSMTIDAGLAARICADVDGYYINYHTRQDPMGAVRGQWIEL